MKKNKGDKAKKKTSDFCRKILKGGSYSRGHLGLGVLPFYSEKTFSEKDSKPSFKEKVYLLLSGGVIGFLNGFFGGGGGMVCVPILEKVLKLDSKHAHATAIAVIFPLSLISAFIYVFNNYVKSLPLITVGLGVVAGGIIGSYALKILPPKAIRVIFALIMFIGGIKLII